MKIIVVGGGGLGSYIIGILAKEGYDITLIEKNKEILMQNLNKFDIAALEGNGVSESVLVEAGVAKTDIVIAVTDHDEVNLACCKVAKTLGAKAVIAKVIDTDYTDQAELLAESFDIDMIINPEKSAAAEIAAMLKFPFADDVSLFARGRASSVIIKIPENSVIGEKSIREINSNSSAKVIVGAIKRNDEVIIPEEDDIIHPGDYVNFVSTTAGINNFFKQTNIYNQKIKSILIIGGSRIAFYLAKFLEDEGVSIKIIEKRESRCDRLIESLNNVEVVCADGTQKEVLEEEGLVNYDACISLTQIDEVNIIVSLYAKSKSVPKVITKYQNIAYSNFMEDLSVGSKISPNAIVSNYILYFVRSYRAKKENTIESMRKIMDDKIEILELNVNDDNHMVGMKISDIKTKPGIIISCVIRKQKAMVPEPDFVIEADDKIVISANKIVKGIDGILK